MICYFHDATNPLHSRTENGLKNFMLVVMAGAFSPPETHGIQSYNTDGLAIAE